MFPEATLRKEGLTGTRCRRGAVSSLFHAAASAFVLRHRSLKKKKKPAASGSGGGSGYPGRAEPLTFLQDVSDSPLRALMQANADDVLGARNGGERI